MAREWVDGFVKGISERPVKRNRRARRLKSEFRAYQDNQKKFTVPLGLARAYHKSQLRT